MNNVTAAYQMVFIIAICVLLPITMASLRYKNKQYETRRKSDILMAAIEKNADINVQDFLNKFNPPRKSFEEKMKTMLHLELLCGAQYSSSWGCFACFVSSDYAASKASTQSL